MIAVVSFAGAAAFTAFILSRKFFNRNPWGTCVGAAVGGAILIGFLFGNPVTMYTFLFLSLAFVAVLCGAIIGATIEHFIRKPKKVVVVNPNTAKV